MTVRICELIAIFAHHQVDYLAKALMLLHFLFETAVFSVGFFVTSTNLG